MELFRTPEPPPPQNPQCQVRGAHRGHVHECEAQCIAKPDGTPIFDGKKEKAYFCEGHFPDSSDPKYLLCTCRLCKERKRGN